MCRSTDTARPSYPTHRHRTAVSGWLGRRRTRSPCPRWSSTSCGAARGSARRRRCSGSPSPGRTHTARRRIEAEVWAALRERRPGWAPGPIPTSNVSFTCSRSRQSGWRFARGAPPPSAPHWPVGLTAPCSHGAPATRWSLDAVHLARRRRGRRPRPARPGPGRAAVVAAVDLEGALRRPVGCGPAHGPRRPRGRSRRGGSDGTDAARHRRRAQITVPSRTAWGVLRRSGELARGARRPARPLPDDPLPRRRRHRWTTSRRSTTVGCATG